MSETNLPKKRKANSPTGGSHEPIPSWQLEHAAWVARQPEKPTKAQQIDKAEELAQKTITDWAFRKFTKQEEYIKALLKYQLSQIERVKDTLLRRLDKYAERFDWAVDEAKEMGDYRTVGQLAMKPLENTVWKNKDDKPQTASVTINISEARLSGLEADIPEVEVEEITDGEGEEDY